MAVGHYNTFTESFYTLEQCQHWLHGGRAGAINEGAQLESTAHLAMQGKKGYLGHCAIVIECNSENVVSGKLTLT